MSVDLYHTVSCQIEFAYAHRLLNYDGKCNRLHGHNGIVVVHANGVIDDNSGFVLDFSVLKRVVKKHVDHWDHRTLLNADDPLLKVIAQAPGGKQMLVSMSCAPTAENMARMLMCSLRNVEGLDIVMVEIYETQNNKAVCLADDEQLEQANGETFPSISVCANGKIE